MDTGVLVAYYSDRDRRHGQAKELMTSAMQGAFGALVVSDFVVDEAVTLCRARSRSHALANALAARLLGEAPHAPLLTLIRVSGHDFTEARRLFARYEDKELSFTDCTSIALMRARGIDRIASFDEDFDGIVERVHEAPVTSTG